MPFQAGSSLHAYGCAVVSVALATLLRLSLDPLLGVNFPFATILFAVLLTAWYAGFRAAFAAVVLGACSSAYFLLPPRGSFRLEGVDNQTGMVLYLTTSFGIALLGGALRAANERLDVRVRARTLELALANEALQAAEERARLLIDGVQEYAIVMLDNDGHIVSWNAGAEKILGYRSQEIVGHHVSRLYAQDDVARGQPTKELQMVRAEGRRQSEGWRVRKDGSRFWARIAATAVTDQAGALRGFAKLMRDITESKQADERFRQAVESAPNGMVMIDARGQIVLVNTQTERLFGYRRDELLGQPVELLVPERFRGQHPDHRVGFFARPQVRSIGIGRDLYGRRRDGSEFPVEIGLNPIKIDDRLLVLSAVVDITERKSAEATLRASEARLAAVIENMTEGVVMSDLDGRLVHWNRAALEMHGFASAEGSRRSLSEFVNDFELATLQGAVVSIEEWPLSRLLRGEPLRDYQLRVRRRDRHWERILSYGGALVQNVVGRRIAFCTMTDITDRKQTEESIAGYNQRLNILHQIDQALIGGTSPAEIAAGALPPLRDLLGARRVVVNLLDLAKGEVEWLAATGRRRLHIGPGVRYTTEFMGDVDALRRGEPQEIDVHTLPPGPEVDALLASGVHCYAVVPMLAKGELIGAISFGGTATPFSPEQYGIVREVGTQIAIAITQARLHERVQHQAEELEIRVRQRTQELEAAHVALQTSNAELVELAAELTVANKELDAFTYSVSHDLRAPLRAIDGFSRILLEDYAAILPAEANSYLHDVRASTQHMGRLVDDLLALSRLSRQPVRRQTVDPELMVQQCLEELRAVHEGRRVDIHIGPLRPCSADPGLLKQVWTNLLTNALKYTGKRPHAVIEVGCRRDHGQDVYFVKDNGVGFEMRYAHKLFGVFQRLHRAEDYQGTGVGLAIVQRIIHRHSGKVWADAEPDRGATFLFTLNANSADDAARHSILDSPQDASKGGTGCA